MSVFEGILGLAIIFLTAYLVRRLLRASELHDPRSSFYIFNAILLGATGVIVAVSIWPWAGGF